ncbi:MAG: hypothetical protein G01um101470_731, partial [Parcubacteria group bacterium Gr01-1014_70]
MITKPQQPRETQYPEILGPEKPDV